jgi:hypothetical protein
LEDGIGVDRHASVVAKSVRAMLGFEGEYLSTR